MKLILRAFLCALVGIAPNLHGAPPGSAKATDEVLAADRAWAKAAVDANAKIMASFMSDEYLEIMQNPATATNKAVWTFQRKTEWVEMVRTGRDKYDSVVLNNMKVHFDGDIAIVTGEYSQKGTTDGKDNSSAGLYVDTWTKRNGRWLIVSSVFP